MEAVERVARSHDSLGWLRVLPVLDRNHVTGAMTLATVSAKRQVQEFKGAVTALQAMARRQLLLLLLLLLLRNTC